MKDKEIWKAIPWYEWYYEASSLWKVRSLDRIIKSHFHWVARSKERILRLANNWWYSTARLYKDWYNSAFKVHRLVYCSFNWLDLKFTWQNLVCHKNDIRNDNRLENLFLWTPLDNVLDCENKWRWIHIWQKWETNWTAKLTDRKVKLIKLMIDMWETQRFIAKHWEVSTCTISNISKLKSWKHITI